MSHVAPDSAPIPHLRVTDHTRRLGQSSRNVRRCRNGCVGRQRADAYRSLGFADTAQVAHSTDVDQDSRVGHAQLHGW